MGQRGEERDGDQKRERGGEEEEEELSDALIDNVIYEQFYVLNSACNLTNQHLVRIVLSNLSEKYTQVH